MQRLIDSFNKNSIEIVKVNLQEWKGQAYFDIRIWLMENPAEPGSETPSYKGITLSIDLLPRLIEALIKAREEFGKENNLEVNNGKTTN